MYIYNITTNVDQSIHEEWLDWMRETNIPDMLATGNFSKALMTEVMVNEELGGITYSVQFTCNSKEKLDNYLLENDQKMLARGIELFGNKLGNFCTVMKTVKQYGI